MGGRLVSEILDRQKSDDYIVTSSLTEKNLFNLLTDIFQSQNRGAICYTAKSPLLGRSYANVVGLDMRLMSTIQHTRGILDVKSFDRFKASVVGQSHRP